MTFLSYRNWYSQSSWIDWFYWIYWSYLPVQVWWRRARLPS